MKLKIQASLIVFFILQPFLSFAIDNSYTQSINMDNPYAVELPANAFTPSSITDYSALPSLALRSAPDTGGDISGGGGSGIGRDIPVNDSFYFILFLFIIYIFFQAIKQRKQVIHHVN